jgi:low temperature requirement protein LtrA
VLIAAALKHATGHPLAALDRPWAFALSGGAAVFLAGEALFRRTLALGGDRERALAAVVALLTIPIGTALAAAGQVVALLAVFVVMLVVADGTRERAPGRVLQTPH